MGIFSQLVHYLTDPVVIFGMILFLGLLLVRYLLSHEIIEHLPAKLDGKIPRLLLSYGFVIGLLIVVMGVGLKHRELSLAEEQHAFRMLDDEYRKNITTINTLLANTEQALQTHQAVTASLRADDSKILQIIFPTEHITTKTDVNIAQLVDASFQELKSSGVLKNEASMAQFNAAKNQIKSNIGQQIEILKSLQISEENRFVIEQEVWSNHMNVYNNTDDFDVVEFEESLIQMEELRDNYITVLRKTREYFEVARDFMDRSTFIGNGDVYEILTQEQTAQELLKIYANDLQNQLALLEQKGQLTKRN